MQTAANGFATMLQVYKVEYVSPESPINIRLRGIAALGMALGILLGGWRLVPVSGATICMTLVLDQIN
jgi:phosphate/sulfate permease